MITLKGYHSIFRAILLTWKKADCYNFGQRQAQRHVQFLIQTFHLTILVECTPLPMISLVGGFIRYLWWDYNRFKQLVSSRGQVKPFLLHQHWWAECMWPAGHMSPLLAQLHQCFTISICASRSQKRKKTLMTWLSWWNRPQACNKCNGVLWKLQNRHTIVTQKL